MMEVGGQAVLGRQQWAPTPWLTERHGYDPTSLASYLARFVSQTKHHGFGAAVKETVKWITKK